MLSVLTFWATAHCVDFTSLSHKASELNLAPSVSAPSLLAVIQSCSLGAEDFNYFGLFMLFCVNDLPVLVIRFLC